MATEGQIRVGVLALQGDVAEHVRALRGVGADGVLVKTRAELASVKGLIIPGGESTTVMKLLERFDLCEPIRRCAAAGMPLWGTCMGMIVMARQVVGTEQPSLGLLDVSVRRNAFGRQSESDEFKLEVPALGVPSFPAIFIRAPWVERAGSAVQVLARRDGHGVMVRQGNLLGTSFHPELSDDPRVHRYFTDMVRGAKR
ncbi:MAG: pyridoxal 5'-phosphate synthase glutaminase subunit PdxT [Candidatus Eremiobacteraeota bacterium]|nr:pyridoxal 5'-phosphate synthase glutaminase subunit PdxT [Candidatus Eremiobacteraeota bacterium]